MATAMHKEVCMKIMKYGLTLLAFCFWATVLAGPCLAKDWNNIFPLKTNRAEVIKILGDPKLFNGPGTEYWDFESDRIRILWTLPHCFSDKFAGPDSKYGSKVIIDEKYITPETLVYSIRVEPKNPGAGKYEEEVRQYLELTNGTDCIGSRGGSCGTFHVGLGLGYGRSDLGVTSMRYMATWEEESVWRLGLKPCTSDGSGTDNPPKLQ